MSINASVFIIIDNGIGRELSLSFAFTKAGCGRAEPLHIL